jgi:ankyrin repeat protein
MMAQPRTPTNSSSPNPEKIHEIVRRKDITTLKKAAQFAKAHGSLDDFDKDGNTALHVAVICQTIECAKILLENGANPNIPTESLYDSSVGMYFASRAPLFYAMKRQNAEQMIELLISYGASIDDLRGEGATAAGEKDPALKYAIMDGDVNMVRFLIKKGADVNTVIDGKTLIQFANGWPPEHGITPMDNPFLRAPDTLDEIPYPARPKDRIIQILQQAGAIEGKPNK